MEETVKEYVRKTDDKLRTITAEQFKHLERKLTDKYRSMVDKMQIEWINMTEYLNGAMASLKTQVDSLKSNVTELHTHDILGTVDELRRKVDSFQSALSNDFTGSLLTEMESLPTDTNPAAAAMGDDDIDDLYILASQFDEVQIAFWNQSRDTLKKLELIRKGLKTAHRRGNRTLVEHHRDDRAGGSSQGQADVSFLAGIKHKMMTGLFAQPRSEAPSTPPHTSPREGRRPDFVPSIRDFHRATCASASSTPVRVTTKPPLAHHRTLHPHRRPLRQALAASSRVQQDDVQYTRVVEGGGRTEERTRK
ncbi:unnamed protein product [Vitrella brassicaformis CCMP3155]|uniref:Uncharacterized protein n=1 Tax=Vitrella brassicaformis (strain CCMP3155) TaxID=1169540 RepID=A0A0G4EXU5_VITBC|nr:unnamed protein product [Vitrella brassicaformis CCMP3155]|eukprot:CEM03434.1 unnamed protein product [Vitrella brassicaformis CCMP3155]